MNAFLKLALEGAPLQTLLEAAAAALQSGGVTIEDRDGSPIMQAGNPPQSSAALLALQWDGERIGTLLVNGTANVPEIVLKTLSGELVIYNGRNRGLEMNLRQVFDRENAAPQIAEKEFTEKELSLGYCGGQYLLFFMDTGGMKEQRLPELKQELTAQAPAAAAFDSDKIACLYRLGSPAVHTLASSLLTLTRNFDAPGVLSQPFEGRRLLQQLRLQKLALQAGTRLYPGQSFFRFESLASFALFRAAQRNLCLSNYHSEEVLRIIHYDYEKDTALARSLYAYLFYFMDLKAAAQDMKVHRNTLDYQVKKISQILGSLPDTAKRFEMMCTYEMLAMEDSNL